GSRQVLDDAGAWPVAATAIHQIHVSRRGHFGRTLIDRADHGVEALGYVTRYGALVSRLAAAVTAVSMRPVQVLALAERAGDVALTLSDGRTVTAAMVVQSEGGLFGNQQQKSLYRDYRQTALIAHVTTSAAVPQRAFERFTDEGPLALLPQDDGYALVWCMRPETAGRMMALPDAAFLAALSVAFGTRVGRFESVTPRTTYALGLNADPATSARCVAIGNAAQTLHPVAGQGLNLGLRDAAVLARCLARDASPAALQAFANSRKVDRTLTIRLTDAMARVFAMSPDGSLSQTLLGLSLGAVDALPPLRQLLAEQMMFGRR
ncbi:MAG: FAD-dependent monooxygenase, partial [Herminiimonas sp.]|nr:FAD-dependent monooxygenase [Herminiimonas sp.]